MAKQRDLKPRPERDSGDRGVRPLSRNKTKIFVLLAALSAFAFVAFTIFMLIRSMEDPDIQRGLDDYRRDTGQTQDTTEVIPEPD
jgi:hypothetical protein